MTLPATTKLCDRRCVGVLINDDDGRQLLIQRNTKPWGMAPVAGHLDGHGTPLDTARAETNEEVGLSVPALAPLGDREGLWLPNRCRRTTAPGQPVGHRWWLFSGSIRGGSRIDIPVNREVAAAGWFLKPEVEALADRTVDYAVGKVTEREFFEKPGLEPVWTLLLQRLGHLHLPKPHLAAVAELCLVEEPVNPPR